MNNVGAGPSPAVRLVAKGRVLAGFLTAESVATIPMFSQAPTDVKERVHALLGHRPTTNAPVTTVFRHIDEADVLAVLGGLTASAGPLSLTNLVGFEWVRIEGILAGHYIAAPMPEPGRCPDSTAPSGKIAEYCLLGSPIEQNDLVPLDARGFVSPEPLRFEPASIRIQGPLISVDYRIQRPALPITVLSIDHRVVALKRQERLVALREAGIKEALCLVCYGFGTQVLNALPTVAAELLNSERPPLVSDFSDDNVSVSVPVHTPRTLIKFFYDVTDLAPTA